MHFLSVCVCIKNERPYMAEFIRHYLAQGVDHVYIVDNGSTDGGIDSLPECGASVTIIHDPTDYHIFSLASGPMTHSKMFTVNFLARLRAETQWAILVDADEFMFGKNGHSLKSYVQTVPADVNRVYVFWNILSPPPCEPADLRETFHLGQNRRRLNYDKFYTDHVSELVRRYSGFGKSIFRPAHTDLARGLWLHKVFVHGRAITNYGTEDTTATRFSDTAPLPVFSEEAYQKLDVTLHHYCIRGRADYLKRVDQILARSNSPYFNALISLLRNRDAEAFVDDDALSGGALVATDAPKATTSAPHSPANRKRGGGDVIDADKEAVGDPASKKARIVCGDGSNTTGM